ncbi:MAG: D-alanyl-D-alanine carboxypeptidase/D-alanyl-D-alanine-endopeptidase [Bdellovibrionota bacterium]
MKISKAVCVGLCLISSVGFADQELEQELTKILASEHLTKKSISISVRNASTGQVVFEKNPNALINPASSIKLVTSLVALDLLGTQHRFSTSLLRQGKDLCVRGGGDPSFVQEDMWLLTERLFAKMPTIENVILDVSMFESNRSYAEDFSGDHHRSFAAVLSPLSLNHNSITIEIEGQDHGKPAWIRIQPPLPDVVVQSQVSSSKNAGMKDVGVEIETKKDQWIIRLNGKVPPGKTIFLYRSVPDPLEYFWKTFSHYYRLQGGMLGQSWTKQSCTQDAQKLFDYESKPLSWIVHGMNKFSSNFFAESLVYQLSPSHTYESGMAAIDQWITSHLPSSKDMVLQNASGLSRGTKVSASWMTDVVLEGKKHFEFGPEWISSMSVYGKDGTLRRFKDPVLRGVVRAKSGSLKDVVSLVGLVQNQDHAEMAFAFLFEDTAQPTWKIQQVEEKLLRALALHKTKPTH